MGMAPWSGRAPDGGGDALASHLTPPPWRWIAAAVAVVCALLYATLSRYGYHRDELYFRMLPARWGYVDQPFLTPLLAKVSIRLFGDTVFGLRALAPLVTAAGVVLAALTARELGGSRRAQGLGAWAATTSSPAPSTSPSGRPRCWRSLARCCATPAGGSLRERSWASQPTTSCSSRFWSSPWRSGSLLWGHGRSCAHTICGQECSSPWCWPRPQCSTKRPITSPS
jgi:hypothetical protein